MCFTRVSLLSLVALTLVFSSGSVADAAERCDPSSTVLLGDVNLDGFVNLLDVAPFLALVAAEDYMEEADINTDGGVNIRDIPGFLDLMAGKVD